ncbi:hypothetical protein RGQ29_021365 [Quercus rubra]|uniref:UPF3 domain-containing protein n=1 Tax=Quercus rubra TaxID=3512 RepID=A0AAN7FIX3_QUERU|nr:hypothetical protein RGQ29_021365 [Quercus rubra]
MFSTLQSILMDVLLFMRRVLSIRFKLNILLHRRLQSQLLRRMVVKGTIYKDPDYLEFLKIIAKPAEHLPSAEIQLERKEAEAGFCCKRSSYCYSNYGICSSVRSR